MVMRDYTPVFLKRKHKRKESAPAGVAETGKKGVQKIAGGGTRTLMRFPSLDFESSASTSSTTPARCMYTLALWQSQVLFPRPFSFAPFHAATVKKV
jgi:hypothetical protein